MRPGQDQKLSSLDTAGVFFSPPDFLAIPGSFLDLPNRHQIVSKGKVSKDVEYRIIQRLKRIVVCQVQQRC
jgi:hypothetical protein